MSNQEWIYENAYTSVIQLLCTLESYALKLFNKAKQSQRDITSINYAILIRKFNICCFIYDLQSASG